MCNCLNAVLDLVSTGQAGFGQVSLGRCARPRGVFSFADVLDMLIHRATVLEFTSWPSKNEISKAMDRVPNKSILRSKCSYSQNALASMVSSFIVKTL